MSLDTNHQPTTHQDLKVRKATTLNDMVAMACFCKLREICIDKTSTECMKHRNIYQEFMHSKK